MQLPESEYRALVESLVASLTASIAPATGGPAVPQPGPATAAALSPAAVAGVIEHTLLKPDATRDQVLELCREARRHGFIGVCVNPAWVGLAAAALRDSPVLVVVVNGFPLGATLTTAKRSEAAECLKLGADEIDMVLNIGALKSGLDELVREDIRGVCQLAHDAGARVKLILETALLSDEEKIRACRLAVAAGADCVKTSTGFAAAGATAHDVALMRATVGDATCVKAAGGVRSLAELTAMVAAGATRIGTSSGVRIMQELAGAPAAALAANKAY